MRPRATASATTQQGVRLQPVGLQLRAHPAGVLWIDAVIVVTNRIPLARGHEIDFEDRFKRRVHLIDRHPGVIREEVHRARPTRFDHEHGTWAFDPEERGYDEVKARGRSFDDFVAWTGSADFAAAHTNRPPREMFSPNALEVLTSMDLDVGAR